MAKKFAEPFGDKHPCPICRAEAEIRPTQSIDEYLCQRCGRFDIAPTAVRLLELSPLQGQPLANASGWIREQRRIRIISNDVPMLGALPTPSVVERARKALRHLAKLRPGIGQRLNIDFRALAPEWLAVTWSQTNEEVQYLFVDVLHPRKLIEAPYVGGNRELGRIEGAYITPAGHEELDRFASGGKGSSLGFCAMWFDKSLDAVWTEAIAPGISEAGYEAKRIDNVEHNNKIDDEIVATIRRSRFVVADFTGQRGGVYFEAGFAIGLSLPVVWTVRSDDLAKVRFDNRQYNFIEWSTEDLPQFRRRLRNRIEATIGKGPLTRS